MTYGEDYERSYSPDLEGRARSAALVFDQGLGQSQAGRVQQIRPQEAQGPREVVLHPKVDSDLDSLPQKVQDTFHERVEMLRRGDRHSSTHPLNGPLKGWQGTSIGGNQYRMMHRMQGNELQILSAGSHDQAYNQGKRRAVAHFTPKLRVFTHTCGLDHRLWDASGQLKPEVRNYILSSVVQMWAGKYKDWSRWANIYFAGSEASEWTSETLEGNNDFDVLIGVDYGKFRKANPQYANASNEEITDEMNHGFREFNGPLMLTVDGVQTGPWDRTTYVNIGYDDHGTYDLRVIKPYAAYSVSEDRWVVRPPHLPHWSLSELPSPVQRVLRATDTLARDVLKLPEPERTQQGAALFDAWHSDRSRAFSPNGEGWYDIANLREKWLDQSGLWAEIVDCKHRFTEGLGAAPSDWSNVPTGYVAKVAAASGFSEHNQFAERLDKGPDEEPYLHAHKDEYARDYTAPTGHQYRLLNHNTMVTAHRRLSNGKYQGVGYLSWFGGQPRHDNNNIDGGVIYKVQVSGPHRRRGVASAMLDFAREKHPEQDIRHSNALSDDGRAWSEKKASLLHDRLDEIGQKEHPNVDHYRSGGIGHLEGDESRSVVGFVPTNLLLGYEGNQTHNPDTVRHIRDDIKSGKGITNPLMMVYDHKNKWAYLGEGNHRLEGATEAGARTVPVRFVRGSADYEKSRGIGGSMEAHTDFGHGEDYVPSDIHPYHFLQDSDHSKLAVTDKWPPYLTEREDKYGDKYPVNTSRSNVRGPVSSEEEAQAAGLSGPYYHGTSKNRARQIQSGGFRQPRMHNYEMEGAGNAEEVDFGNTHRTFFTEKPEEALHFARAHHGDDAAVVKAYIHPDHVEHDSGGGWMPSVQCRDAAKITAIRPDTKTGSQDKILLHRGIGDYDGKRWDGKRYEHAHELLGDMQEDSPHTGRWWSDKESTARFYAGNGVVISAEFPTHKVKDPPHSEGYLVDHGTEGTVRRITVGDHSDRSAPIRDLRVRDGLTLTSARQHDLYGQGIDRMFPEGATDTVAPWPQAGRKKTVQDYDKDLVTRSITHPHEFSVEELDPRELHSMQPKVTRAGVSHYVQHGQEGETFDNDHRLGNDLPRVYHRIDDNQKLILSGHHRAAAALAEGRPFKAMVIRGGWGSPR